MKNLGIIDIGSNSVRLMVSQKGVIPVKTTVTTRLGEGLIANGFLLDSAIERSIDCIKEFNRKCKNENLEVYAFATAAVRNATNKQVFIDKVFNETGIKVDVISGDKEALLGIKGALNDETGSIIDLGGASTEISVQKDKKIIYSHSLPVGCVLIKDITKNNREVAENFVLEKIKEYGNIPYTTKLVGVGGTVTNIASTLLHLEPYDPTIVQDYCIEYDDLSKLVDKLYNLTIEERKQIKGLNKVRADVIDGGALLLLRIMEKFGYKRIYASEKDNLEGYLQTIQKGNNNE